VVVAYNFHMECGQCIQDYGLNIGRKRLLEVSAVLGRLIVIDASVI
jgi:hypothetical protein